jgi:hypothetical protein
MYLAKFYLEEISGKWYPVSHMDMEQAIKRRQCPVRGIFESAIKTRGQTFRKKKVCYISLNPFPTTASCISCFPKKIT